jgi:hypothetical protein
MKSFLTASLVAALIIATMNAHDQDLTDTQEHAKVRLLHYLILSSSQAQLTTTTVTAAHYYFACP